MKVTISVDNPHKIFHKSGCYYIDRIMDKNRLELTLAQASIQGYCRCKYCCGLGGEIRTNLESLGLLGKELNLKIYYDADTNVLFIRSDCGFWKIVESSVNGQYLLFHSNHYRVELSDAQLQRGNFHRQKDVRGYKTIASMIRYIAGHDQAKKTIADDYRKLPQETRKQKKYYRQAKKKAQWGSQIRTYRLFEMLERQDPELKAYAVW